jgi:hypothetical protein
MEKKKHTISDSDFRIRLTIAGAYLEGEPSSLGPGLQVHIEVETICLVEPFVYCAISNGYILSTTTSMWNTAAQAFSVVESTVRIALSSACSRISNRYRIFDISGEDHNNVFQDKCDVSSYANIWSTWAQGLVSKVHISIMHRVLQSAKHTVKSFIFRKTYYVIQQRRSLTILSWWSSSECLKVSKDTFDLHLKESQRCEDSDGSLVIW